MGWGDCSYYFLIYLLNKYGSVWGGCGWVCVWWMYMCGILIRRNTHWQKRPQEGHVTAENEMTQLQVQKGRGWQEPRVTGTRQVDSLRASRRNQPCSHPDFRALAPKPERTNFWCFRPFGLGQFGTIILENECGPATHSRMLEMGKVRWEISSFSYLLSIIY